MPIAAVVAQFPSPDRVVFEPGAELLLDLAPELTAQLPTLSTQSLALGVGSFVLGHVPLGLVLVALSRPHLGLGSCLSESWSKSTRLLALSSLRVLALGTIGCLALLACLALSLSLAWHPNELLRDVVPGSVWVSAACAAVLTQPVLDLCHAASVSGSDSLVRVVRSALTQIRQSAWRSVGVWLGFAVSGWCVVGLSLCVTQQVGVSAAGPTLWALCVREASFACWVCLRVLWLRHATRLVQAQPGSSHAAR
jgi:hypothetical protein